MRRALIALPVVAMAVVAATLWATQGDSGPGPGPLEGADEFSESQPIPVNEPYDMASLATFFDNRGKKAITIDRARLLGVAGPLELLELRSHRIIAGVPGNTEVYGGGIVKTSEARFPTDPLAGHNTVPVPTLFSKTGNPDEGLQLLFRVVMTERGIGRWNGMEIDYRAGNKHHREVFPWKVWICAPKEDYVGEGKPECEMDAPFGTRVLELSAGRP